MKEHQFYSAPKSCEIGHIAGYSLYVKEKQLPKKLILAAASFIRSLVNESLRKTLGERIPSSITPVVPKLLLDT